MLISDYMITTVPYIMTSQSAFYLYHQDWRHLVNLNMVFTVSHVSSKILDTDSNVDTIDFNHLILFCHYCAPPLH